jgi:hypothetical protein
MMSQATPSSPTAIKVGGTHRRLAGGLIFFGRDSCFAFSFCFSAADFRVLDSGTRFSLLLK